MAPGRRDVPLAVQRVKTDGLRAFRKVVGYNLSNELIDNFPVHRFAIQGGSVKEVFVTLAGGTLTEVLDEPSSPRLAERLHPLRRVPSRRVPRRGQLGPGGLDGPACPRPRSRGFILTIDYGQLATDLYSPPESPGDAGLLPSPRRQP